MSNRRHQPGDRGGVRPGPGAVRAAARRAGRRRPAEGLCPGEQPDHAGGQLPRRDRAAANPAALIPMISRSPTAASWSTTTGSPPTAGCSSAAASAIRPTRRATSPPSCARTWRRCSRRLRGVAIDPRLGRPGVDHHEPAAAHGPQGEVLFAHGYSGMGVLPLDPGGKLLVEAMLGETDRSTSSRRSSRRRFPAAWPSRAAARPGHALVRAAGSTVKGASPERMARAMTKAATPPTIGAGHGPDRSTGATS
jgi:hypothetical protein